MNAAIIRKIEESNVEGGLMVRYYLLNLDIFNLGKDMLDMSYLIMNPRDHEYP